MVQYNQLRYSLGVFMKKIISVSVLGVGGRGGFVYSSIMNGMQDKFKLTAFCDINKTRLEYFSNAYGVDEKNRFLSETEFFKEKRADLLIIATMDKDHVREAKIALNLGYDILLEKPISCDKKELRELLKLATKLNRKVVVCHVLRYTVAVQKISEILDSGAIGKLISIDQTENVIFWHAASSFVRGNWRRREETAPMIMAKCCHDLDLLQYFAKSKCKSISSIGERAYFKGEFKPSGSAERCIDCKYVESCVYSAKKIYLDRWKENGCHPEFWPTNCIVERVPITEEGVYKSLRETNYGRCVFACDNNVVDNQTVLMEFENGVNACLKMQSFTKYGGREIRFFGADGELLLDEPGDKIILKKFFGEDKEWKISEIASDLSFHGGGDKRLVENLYNVLIKDNVSAETMLANSIESHLMAIASEDSRRKKGKLVSLKQYR